LKSEVYFRTCVCINLILQKAIIFSSQLGTGNVCVSGNHTHTHTHTAAGTFVCSNCRCNIYLSIPSAATGWQSPLQQVLVSPSAPRHMR